MKYWLMKSEPNCYSIDDLKAEKTTHWDGVRNYQVRNMMRDDMKVGDLAFFYHSNAKPPAVVGIMKVVKEGYPDHSAFDPEDEHYDPKSDPENPRWMMVDVKFEKKFNRPIPLEEIRQNPALNDLALVKKGCRLSVMPVTKTEWQSILDMEN